MTGCWPSTIPATAEDDGCVVMARLAAAPALTVTLAFVEASPDDAKVNVTEPLFVRYKPLKVATPLMALMLAVPCTVPRLAVTATLALDVVGLP